MPQPRVKCTAVRDIDRKGPEDEHKSSNKPTIQHSHPPAASTSRSRHRSRSAPCNGWPSAPPAGSAPTSSPCSASPRRLPPALCYALSRYNRYALLGVILCLALNWLGDSLDGTLARVRQQQRPRYGFYVDHMVDIFGSVALMCGLGCSGFLHWQTAIAMLVAFLLLSSESYLATYTLSCFRALAGPLRPHRDSHPAHHRQPRAAAQSVLDALRPHDAALRSWRSDRRRRHVRHGDRRHRPPHGRALPAGAAAMNTLIRWAKFNLVGAMGMPVQLAALAALQPLRPRPLSCRLRRGHRAHAAAQLRVAHPLHLARPP